MKITSSEVPEAKWEDRGSYGSVLCLMYDNAPWTIWIEASPRNLPLYAHGSLFGHSRNLTATTLEAAKVEAVALVRERLTAMLACLPPDPDGCEGTGKCHGSMGWCDRCGDVSKVCDDPACDAHPRTL